MSLDAINITDDAVPETNETFTLSLMKDESERGDTLNVNPRNTILELTIVDNDGTWVEYNVINSSHSIKYLYTCH